MSNHWIRWHVGTSEDGKFRMIARNGGVTVSNAVALWALLLEDASHPEHRGICTRGEDFYGAILDLEFDVVASILAAMERLGMVSIGMGNITICNWNKRQFETDAIDPTNAERQRRFRENKKHNENLTERNGSVTANKHQIQNTDTEQKEREVQTSQGEALPKIPKTKSSRGTRLTPDWDLPESWGEWAEKQGMTPASIVRECDKFKDYWISKSGAGGTKNDWEATWRNWIRRHLEDYAA